MARARSVHQRAGGSGGPEEQPLADARTDLQDIVVDMTGVAETDLGCAGVRAIPVGVDEHLRQRRLVRQCQCTRGPSLRDLPAVHDRDRWSRCDRRPGDRSVSHGAAPPRGRSGRGVPSPAPGRQSHPRGSPRASSRSRPCSSLSTFGSPAHEPVRWSSSTSIASPGRSAQPPGTALGVRPRPARIADSVALAVGPGALAHTAQE